MSTPPDSQQSPQPLLYHDQFQAAAPHRHQLTDPTMRPGMLSPSQSLSIGSGGSPSLSPPSRSHTLDLSPPSYSNNPGTELPPIQPLTEKVSSPSNHTLPPLSSVTGGPPPPVPPVHQRQPEPIKHWPSLNPLTAFYAPSATLDDPNVRDAVEGLENLKFAHDRKTSSSLGGTPRPGVSPSREASEQTPEPLLSLITTTVPSLASTVEKGTTLVENAASLYNQGKKMSPTVVKNGVEYVEGYLSPVAKVVGNVSRKTGMEGGVRWFLNRRRHKAPDDNGRSWSKRRKTMLTERDVATVGGHSRTMDLDQDRRMSISTVETLPAYDDLKSPAYTETAEPTDQQTSGLDSSSGLPQRVRVSTSSLTAAMSDQALQSLKFCIERVRATNASIAQLIETLQTTVEQYDAVAAKQGEGDSQSTAGDRSRLITQMTTLKTEIYSRLFGAVELVSRYCGEYLPKNVEELVRASLKSLPSRFPWQTFTEAGKKGTDQERETREVANVVLQFAREGLRTMASITDILETTIDCAEAWLDQMRYKRETPAAPLTTAEPAYGSKNTTTAYFSATRSPANTVDNDVVMGESR